MADSVPKVAHLASSLAKGCAKILVPLLWFLSRPSPRSVAVDEAAVSVLVVLPVAYVSAVIVAHFADVVLAYLHLATAASVPAPAAAAAVSFLGAGQFMVMVFTLVFAHLLVMAVPLTFFFFFLGAGKQGICPGFSWNVLG